VGAQNDAGLAVGDELAETVGTAVGDGPQQIVVAGDADDGIVLRRRLAELRLVPPTWAASSKVTRAPSSLA
jgi:hypothetical protein